MTSPTLACAGLRWPALAAQCAHAAAWGLKTQIHAVGDGAPGIADQAQIPFGPQGGYIVDRFHVCDSFTAAAPDPAHAKDDVTPLREPAEAEHAAQAKARARHRRRHPFARGPPRKRLRAGPRRPAPPQRTPGKSPTRKLPCPALPCPAPNAREISDPQDPVRAELRYLENRPAQLAYAYALAPDSPEGSSLIESRHKHVLPAPLKKSGGWREESHAHAMRQLRTLRANHLWNKYWSNN